MKGINSLSILLGEDLLRSDEFIQNLKNNLSAKGITYESETIDCSEAEVPLIIEKLKTFPLFTNKVILILKNFASLFADTEGLKEILPPLKRIAKEEMSPVILVLFLAWSKEAQAFLKKEGLETYVYNLYPGKEEAIKKELKEKARREGYVIDEDALALFFTYAGEDYTQIDKEYEKAKLYAADARITRDLLEEIISPVKRFGIKDLGNAFRNKDKRKTIFAISNLFLYSEKIENIVGYLAGILFRLLSEEKPSRWERKEIVKRLRELAEIDKKIKTTSCDGESLLLKWVAESL